jgi:hypothetical protein
MRVGIVKEFLNFTYSALPDVYGQLSFDPQYSKHKFEVIVGWQNHRAWFHKNDYHKIKIICINKKFTCFFTSIDSVSKSLIIFQKNK